MSRPVLVYASHSGRLYGTERMAVATLDALRDRYEPLLFAPPGPVHAAAAERGLATREVRGVADFVRAFAGALRRGPDAALIATETRTSFAAHWLARALRRPLRHLHAVHGGTEERLSYGRKRLLVRLPLRYVAVSEYVRERLVAHGVPADRIDVAANFVDETRSPLASAPRARGVPARIAVVSRLEAAKRLDVLLDALAILAARRRDGGMEVVLYGTGAEEARLRARAVREGLPATFAGFVSDVGGELRKADLLVHTCPTEPCGLGVLEAMAAGTPVLVPDRGGAAALVEEGVSGFRFRADDPADLARRLDDLRAAPAALLDAVAAAAVRRVAERFSARSNAARYRDLLDAAGRAPTGAGVRRAAV